MSRPVRRHDASQGNPQWRPPEWDPQAIAADYLIEMKQAAQHGPLDPAWVDHLNDWLAHELRSAYSAEQARRAVSLLEPLIARIEQIGVERGRSLRVVRPPEPTPAPAQAPEPPKAAAEPPRPPTSVLPKMVNPRLNGRALRKSVVPTWFGLVACSWVALLWGGVISAPFGVGAVVLGGALLGVIGVPLFATVFGFMGMNRARDSSLRELKFVECQPEHPLNVAAVDFAKALGIPKPRVGTFEAFNAFAMGSNPENATVAMGVPLMTKLSEEETLAVLGHEMGHVVSGDMRKMMLMRTFQNTTVWFMFAQGAKLFARWCLCWVAELFILAFSRKREYWADAIGAALTSKDAMIGSLRKLQKAPALSDAENTHARFMIRGRFDSMLSTHPTFEERIDALKDEIYLRRLPRL